MEDKRQEAAELLEELGIIGIDADGIKSVEQTFCDGTAGRPHAPHTITKIDVKQPVSGIEEAEALAVAWQIAEMVGMGRNNGERQVAIALKGGVHKFTGKVVILGFVLVG